STVLMEFDANADLRLDDAELQEVANTIHASLADFNYFQLVTVDGKDVKMKPPAAIMANFENNQLIILFESEPETPIQLAGDIRLGVYDPTFYTAIDFTEDANMAVEGLPSSCVRTVIRPDPDAALAENQQTLTEAFFNDPAGTDMSKIFATKLELKCQAWGPSLERELRTHNVRPAGGRLYPVAFRRPCPCAKLARHRRQRSPHPHHRHVFGADDLAQPA